MRVLSCVTFVTPRHPVTSDVFFLFFNAPATTVIYTLSLHDALPIFRGGLPGHRVLRRDGLAVPHAGERVHLVEERSEETRLNSSHLGISYAVFCLKKKNTKNNLNRTTTAIIQS